MLCQFGAIWRNIKGERGDTIRVGTRRHKEKGVEHPRAGALDPHRAWLAIHAPWPVGSEAEFGAAAGWGGLCCSMVPLHRMDTQRGGQPLPEDVAGHVAQEALKPSDHYCLSMAQRDAIVSEARDASSATAAYMAVTLAPSHHRRWHAHELRQYVSSGGRIKPAPPVEDASLLAMLTSLSLPQLADRLCGESLVGTIEHLRSGRAALERRLEHLGCTKEEVDHFSSAIATASANELAFPSPLVVRATGGLARRLRMVLTFRGLALERGRPLLVVWQVDGFCPARFGALFQPLVGMSLVEDDAGLMVHHDRCDRTAVCGTLREEQTYMELRPNVALRTEIERRITLLGGARRFVAVHVRRTDFEPDPAEGSSSGAAAADLRTPDAEFFEWLEHPLRADWRIYLATDCATTQRVFLERYGERLVATSLTQFDPEDNEVAANGGTTALRQTSVSAAVVDMWVCVGSANFKGTRRSAFSDAIALLRRCYRLSSADDAHDVERARTPAPVGEPSGAPGPSSQAGGA